MKKKTIEEKNNDFYKKKSRPTSWKGGKVATNQKSPNKDGGSRGALDPKKARDDAYDFGMSLLTKESETRLRTGKLNTFAAREDAKKAANKAGKTLTRKGK